MVWRSYVLRSTAHRTERVFGHVWFRDRGPMMTPRSVRAVRLELTSRTVFSEDTIPYSPFTIHPSGASSSFCKNALRHGGIAHASPSLSPTLRLSHTALHVSISSCAPTVPSSSML
ncbi:hypothetical protein BV25DRAFT_1289539 [Artomyces pyxidatus]|uniref:Uncharacterized protein n=1 Tax=Artomyces pyxidatus TaxID=48021 RepID=A0ACB8SQK7_9AGAM|nr:hypothetical protein BV25DRAFT_1289539 [Artomyces pyxidatus]